LEGRESEISLRNKSASICIEICENLRETLQNSEVVLSAEAFPADFRRFVAQINADK
jgi:hypothetical protein